MNKDLELKCPYCSKKACQSSEEITPPGFCPMPDSEALIDETKTIYLKEERIKAIAINSAKTEAEGYCRWTRVEEIIHFAGRLQAKTIGIAHCAGLAKEAKIAHQIFESHGFKVHSVCCKVGGMDKTDLGLTEEDKVCPGQFEAACNPIAQAHLLNAAGCDLNVVVGLCVGHDSMFFMHSQAPVTVLVVKDRVLGHNPVAALYTATTYYKRLQQSE
jgi:uncharacterized metal-binding protein